MHKGLIVWNYALITLIVVCFIVYGSLYPFAFHPMPPGAVHALLEGWARRPGRGDALANILLYMPLGYFGLLIFRRDVNIVVRAGLAILLGMSLSVTMELTQYYDSGRDTEATDVYTNIAGTIFGVVASQWLGDIWKKLPRERIGDPAVLLLLAAWAGYNLFPFVPVIDLHKYWSALKPLFHDGLTWYSLFNHAVVWLAAAVLVDQAVREQRSGLWFAAFAAVLLGSKILVMDGALTDAEIGGAAIAWGLLVALQGRPRLRLVAACVLLGCSVAAQRLEPFHFVAQARHFNWIPFLSFMQGSIQVDTLSFLEKGFLYGSLIWLLQKNGVPFFVATLAVAGLLLVTSLMEVHLPGRSAEITDAVMALFIGGVIALVRSASSSIAAAPSQAA